MLYEFYVEINRTKEETVVNVLDWHEITQTEWDALSEEKQDQLLQEIYDEVVPDLYVSGWKKA